MKTRFRFRWLICLAAATPVAFAYQYPLSSTAIREAYFAGATANGDSQEFLAQYTHSLPELKVLTYVSSVSIETPYFQVAERARQTANYTAQDAVEEFSAKPPSVFRMQLDICLGQRESQPAKFRITQNDKELVPGSIERTPYFGSSRHGYAPVIGEHIKLQFRADKIGAAPLRVEIDTPEGQHADTTFDLAKLR